MGIFDRHQRRDLRQGDRRRTTGRHRRVVTNGFHAKPADHSIRNSGIRPGGCRGRHGKGSGGERQKLNWRTSIVDTMKALDLDSSLAARRELAGELGYTGDTSDTATMNIWLHGALMTKLAENGGKVPAGLMK